MHTADPAELEDETGEPDDDIDDEELLTSWEANFLLSVGSQDYELTPAQQDKLDEIEDALYQRRAELRRRRNR